MDLNPSTKQYLDNSVTLLEQDCSTRWNLPDQDLDVVFTSNFFEHLPDKESLNRTLHQAHRCLRDGGRLIAMGPNIKYLPASDELRASMADLKLVSDFFVGEFHWEMVLFGFMAIESFAAMRAHGFSAAAFEQAANKREEYKKKIGDKKPVVGTVHPSLFPHLKKLKSDH